MTRHGFGHTLRRTLSVALALALALAPAASVAQTGGGDVVVRLAAGQSIRALAEQYLGDPDLWPEILRASGLAAITDLRPGLELRIPTATIAAANAALDRSLIQIQAANSAGAQIFAPQEIGRAIDLHESALLKRSEREWEVTRLLAVESHAEATSALQKSEASRDIAAEALVSDRQGDVEGQRPEDLAWRGLQVRTILIEEEKVRTLSDSTAQITFRDASRLRLNANSNAVIQRMRYDPLKRTEEARVSLVEGDFYALLSDDQSGRKSFAVDVPDVNANITSGNFWVGNGADGAKFANYDDAVVQVSANGETVTLGRNEGTIVGGAIAPGGKTTVLDPPAPIAPADGATVYSATPSLAWSAIANAAGYWLELAHDQNFDRMAISRFGLETNQYETEPLAPGRYHWRVAALDSFGLPGARSRTVIVDLAEDSIPPFLTIGEPATDAILRQPSVNVIGESEPGASVVIDGNPVEVGPNGHFQAVLTAKPGANTVAVTATDPAGNRTTRERSFTYMADQASVIAFDPAIPRLADGAFVTDNPVMSLSGRTTPNAAVEIRPQGGQNIRAQAVAGATGRFEINLPLTEERGRFDIAIVAPSGFTTTEEIVAVIDDRAPAIALDAVPPRLTATPDLRLAGTVEPGAGLTVGGAAVPLAEGRFDLTLALAAGLNRIEFIATDRVGNVTVDTWSVTYDGEAPALVSSRLAPAGGDRLTVEVIASDASGLAKVAPVTVVSGARQYAAHLRFNRATQAYQGTLAVPAAEQAAAVVGRIELQDDAGNRRIIELN